MFKNTFLLFMTFSLLLTLHSCILSKKYKNMNKAKISFSDIDNFWEAFDRIQHCDNKNDKLKVIEKLIIDRASSGLKSYLKKDNISANTYLKFLTIPKYLSSIRANTLELKKEKINIEQALTKLKVIYPSLKFTDIYFIIGVGSRNGTISKKSLIIGAEKISTDNLTDLSEVQNNRFFLSTIAEKSITTSLVIHEYIHTLQKHNLRTITDKSLLKAAVREGSCDFIAELVTGNIPTAISTYQYGYANEENIKKQFAMEMNSNDWSDWLYNSKTRDERPQDLGYFIGYQISKHFYENSTNKSKAIKEIIESTNVRKMLKESSYFKKKTATNK